MYSHLRHGIQPLSLTVPVANSGFAKGLRVQYSHEFLIVYASALPFDKQKPNSRSWFPISKFIIFLITFIQLIVVDSQAFNWNIRQFPFASGRQKLFRNRSSG